MKMPDDYITDFGFDTISDFIENLYLKSFIDAYPKVKKIPRISELDENKIRDEFHNILCFECGQISDWINNSSIRLGIENQIVTRAHERKRTDIELWIPKLKYVIECKKIKGANKKQYIDEGISRFINHIYIGENEEYAGMSSFVIGGRLENIIKGIIKKISQYSHIQTSDKKICNFEPSFSSTHIKINGKKIHIHHLFFDIKS
jgi:hypothetical protein